MSRAAAAGSLLAVICLAGCASAEPPEITDTPEATTAAPEPPPVVSDEQIAAPDSWALLPGETSMGSWNGEGETSVDVPVDGLGDVSVLYAACSGEATMTVTSTGATPKGDSVWDVECDAVPNRREVHTDDSTRATALRLTVKGEGTWGFVVANAGP